MWQSLSLNTRWGAIALAGYPGRVCVVTVMWVDFCVSYRVHMMCFVFVVVERDAYDKTDRCLLCARRVSSGDVYMNAVRTGFRPAGNNLVTGC